MSGALGSDQDDIQVGSGNNPLEPDVESVREEEGRVFFQVVLQVVVVEGLLMLVGNDHHGHIGPLGGLGVIREDLQAVVFRLGDTGAALLQGDADVQTAVFEIESMGMSLGTEAEDDDIFASQMGEVSVFIIENGSHGGLLI